MSDAKGKRSPQQKIIELVDDSDRDDDDDDVPTSNKRQRTSAAKPPPALTSVYIAFSCGYPLQNDKWGEHSGHETEDTEVLGVYANLKDANKRARLEAYDNDDDSDDDDDDDDDSLFHWQSEPAEWIARRVWVEKRKIQ